MDSFFDALGGLFSRISPGWLLEDPQKARSAGYLVVVGIFVIALIAGIVMSVGARRLSKGNRLHRRLLQRYGGWLGWLGGVGLLIVALRYADVQLLSKRLWTALDLLALIAVGVYFVVYRVRRYPQELADYREEERKRRFLPVARGGTVRRRR